MSAQVQKKIIEILQNLNSPQLAEVLDFVEFLQYRRRKVLPDSEVIDALCGKYKNYLSSSQEFARRKEDEKALEERKW